jgi:hypothetical protein
MFRSQNPVAIVGKVLPRPAIEVLVAGETDGATFVGEHDPRPCAGGIDRRQSGAPCGTNPRV